MVLRYLREKNLLTWLPGYARQLGGRALRRAEATRARKGPRHLLFALCDHYEPLWADVSAEVGRARVRAWRESYPRLFSGFRDADGRSPRHSFFYPGEQYAPELLEPLAELARDGHGEVEVHLHHDGDTEATLERSLRETLDNFAGHGHLSRDPDGRLRYAFIHGNWCLANARRDGRWCGVDAELPLLHRTGCYADFTFPAAPDESQPGIVNEIYWPTGDLSRRRAYEQGARARVGDRRWDRILFIEGPLGLATRRHRIPVWVENGQLDAATPPSARRVRSWVASDIHVEGRPDWVFVKVHTQGAPEKNAASLLGEPGLALHHALARYNDGERWLLHYDTAREMYNIAIAAMDGKDGDPGAWRDYALAPPPVAARR